MIQLPIFVWKFLPYFGLLHSNSSAFYRVIVQVSRGGAPCTTKSHHFRMDKITILDGNQVGYWCKLASLINKYIIIIKQPERFPKTSENPILKRASSVKYPRWIQIPNLTYVHNCIEIKWISSCHSIHFSRWPSVYLQQRRLDMACWRHNSSECTANNTYDSYSFYYWCSTSAGTCFPLQVCIHIQLGWNKLEWWFLFCESCSFHYFLIVPPDKLCLSYRLRWVLLADR